MITIVKLVSEFSFKMFIKCTRSAMSYTNNVYLKHHNRNTKQGFGIIICFVLIWTTFFVKNAYSLPEISLALESHPQGLTCTLYMRKKTPGDIDLWQKLIHDNTKQSILCLYTAQNKTKIKIPNPELSFLEQCAINLIVGNDYPYD